MIEDLAAQGGLAIVYTILGAAGASIVLAVRRERADKAEHAERVDSLYGPMPGHTSLVQAGRGRPSWWPVGADAKAAHRADPGAAVAAPALVEPPAPSPIPVPAPVLPRLDEPAFADHNPSPPPVFAQPAYPGADTRAVGRHAVAPRPSDVDIRAIDAELRARLADPDRTDLTPVVVEDGAR